MTPFNELRSEQLDIWDLRHPTRRQLLKGLLGAGALAAMLVSAPIITNAAPTVSGLSGSVAHGNTLTITGSGFGTKATAAPFMWDDMMGTPNSQAALTARGWDVLWPDAAPTASSNMQYRTAGNPAAAHTHVTQYMRGIHESSGNYHTGQDVVASKLFTFSSGLAIYISWYNHTGAGWTNAGSMSPADGNYKEFGYGAGSTIYEGTNWYQSQWNGGAGSFAPGLEAGKTTNSFIINDDSPNNGFNLSGNVFWGSDGSMINPIGNWRKYEGKLRTGSSGYIKFLQNNVGPIVNYSGNMDSYSGTQRSIGVGGFARACNSLSNIRYFNDVYIDMNPGTTDVPRVMLGNANTYAASTIVEPQIPSAWSTTSITVKVNLGRLPDAGTAWLYVITSDGSMNASGLAVTLGAGGDITPPATPANLQVQ